MGNKTNNNNDDDDDRNRKNNIKQHPKHHLKVEPHLSRSVCLSGFWLGEILIDFCQIVNEMSHKVGDLLTNHRESSLNVRTG